MRRKVDDDDGDGLKTHRGRTYILRLHLWLQKNTGGDRRSKRIVEKRWESACRKHKEKKKEHKYDTTGLKEGGKKSEWKE